MQLAGTPTAHVVECACLVVGDWTYRQKCPLHRTPKRKAPGGWVNPKMLPSGDSGRPLCRRCSQEVPKGRRTFCSKECVHEWRIKTDPGYLREATFQRDRGVCGRCGYDTMADIPDVPNRQRRIRARGTGNLWQADHIKPVIDGGGECGLDNIRTLCSACHKIATAELAARRARERKLQKQPGLFAGAAISEV